MKNSISAQANTSFLPLEDRASYWHDQVRKYIVELDEGQVGTENIQANLLHYDLGEIKLNHITASAHGVQRNSCNISNDARDTLMLGLVLKGEGFALQGSKGAEQKAGDLVIYNSNYPYALAFPNFVEMYVLSLPLQIADKSLGLRNHKNLTKLNRGSIQGDFHLTKVFSLINNFCQGRSDVQTLSSHLLENLSGLLNAKTITTQVKGLEQLLVKSKKTIEHNLQDEEFSVEKLAFLLHTSTRQIARAFQLEGITASNFIRIRRLENCYQEIATQGKTANLSEIAYKWGFNHPAHFSRAFKQQYGVAPSAYKKILTN